MTVQGGTIQIKVPALNDAWGKYIYQYIHMFYTQPNTHICKSIKPYGNKEKHGM